MNQSLQRVRARLHGSKSWGLPEAQGRTGDPKPAGFSALGRAV